MGEKKIHVGVVGAGANTRARHIPNLLAIDGVEVLSVCNRTRESSQRVADEFGIPNVFDHWSDLVLDPDTDAIVIGTWPYMHCPVTLAALEAGKHVLTEARMAMNAGEAHAMLHASRTRPELVTQIVPSPLTLRVDKTIQGLLADGYLGDVLSVELRSGGDWLDPEAPLHWRQEVEYSGRNIMSLGIWYEAILRWVGHCTGVAAKGKTFTKMRKDEQGILRSVRVPELVDVVADMECGAQLHMQISSVSALVGEPEVFLFGSEGTLLLRGDVLFGGRRGDKELGAIPIAPEQEGTWRVEQDFIDAIRGQGEITLTRFEDGVKYMEFTEAVARSIAEERVIPLPLVL